MASNAFGTLLRMTTWGESHGKGIGCVLDGFPSGVELDEEELNECLKKRSPGKRFGTSQRREQDRGTFLSGVFEGRSTGAPIAIWVENTNCDSSPYHATKHIYRPGHASFTYEKKYGHWDYRGGGRASARETVARVAAGYCVRKWLSSYGIVATSWLSRVGKIELSREWEEKKELGTALQSPSVRFFCPDADVEYDIEAYLASLMREGNSVGGVVTCRVDGVPPGIGEPIYDKLEARLAYAMMGLPASKGFEVGEGFSSAACTGASYTDGFICNQKTRTVQPKGNRAGGILAGISTGAPILFRIAFKPASSIRIPIETVDTEGRQVQYSTPQEGKHDPCVAIRAVPVVEAMAYLVLGDLFAMMLSSTSSNKSQ